MKVLITGAHFTPAVAVIEELKKIDGIEIVYVGRKTTLEGDSTQSAESRALPSLGVRFIPVITGRLQRAFSIYTIPSLLKIPVGLLQAFFIVLSERPDVILSFGGYVAVPTVLAGWLFSIPIIIHEQTLVSGLANKICSLFADKIAISFEKSGFKGEKVVLTGNPIRREIVKILKGVKLRHPKGGFLPTVLVVGGNQGSHVINLAVEQCLDKLVKIASVIHVTGDNKFKDYERLEELKRAGELGERYTVERWIGKEYGAILQKADLVVSRAGINTLTEITLLDKPVLLIPIPSSEQKANAKYFEQLGLARILSQSKLSGITLLNNIRLMLKGLSRSEDQVKKTKEIFVPDAAKRLALETMLLPTYPKVSSCDTLRVGKGHWV